MSATIYWFICAREAYPVVVPTIASQQVSFNRQTSNALAGLKNRRHAIGDILARPISKAVKDHLLCDGSAVSRTSFNQLFAEIGTTFGLGDGSTTFNLPDLNTAPLSVPPSLPTQVVTDGGTVSTGDPVQQPTQPSQSGGTSGGNVTTGGAPRKPRLVDDESS